MDDPGRKPIDAGRLEAIENAPRDPHELAVRVTGVDHRPVGGVPVAWSWHAGARLFRSAGPGGHPVSRAHDGVALFRGLVVPEWIEDPAAGQLAPQIVSLDWEWQPVPLDPWPAEPVELRLPPFGSVEVLAPGLPPDASASCSLEVIPDAARAPRKRFRSRVKVPLVDGRAFFPVVALGEELNARVKLQGMSGSYSVSGSGPAAAGETVSLTIDPGGEVVLHGRILTEGGEAAAACSWRAEVAAGNTTAGHFLRTDAEGRFRFVLAEGLRGLALRFLKIEPAESGTPAEVARSRAFRGLEAAMELPPVLPPGEHDLGVLSLKPPPLLVAGTVVDQAGAPVTSARVIGEMLYSVSERDGRESWFRAFPLLDFRGSETGEDGRFEIRGRVTVPGLGRYRLQVSRDGFAPSPPLEIALGSDELRIVLRAGASLGVRFLAPEALAGRRSGWSLELEPAAGGDSLRWSEPEAWSEEAIWTSLPSGLFRLRIRHPCAAGPLATFHDIRLTAGQVLRDPRLQPFDLRDIFGVARLTVLGLDRRPWPKPVRMMWLRPGGGGNGLAAVEEEGSGSYLLPFLRAEPCDLLVGIGESSQVILPAFSSDQEVVLAPPIELDLRLVHPLVPRVKGEEIVLLVDRHRVEGGARIPFSSPKLAGSLHRDGGLRVSFPGSGLYRWSWAIQKSERGTTVQRLEGLPGGEWRIDDSSRGTTLELTPPEELRSSPSGG